MDRRESVTNDVLEFIGLDCVNHFRSGSKESKPLVNGWQQPFPELNDAPNSLGLSCFNNGAQRDLRR